MDNNLPPWLGNKLCEGCDVIKHPLAKQKKPWLCAGTHAWSKESNVASCQGRPPLLQLPWNWCCTAVPCRTLPLPQGRDQVLLCLPSSVLEHGKVVGISRCHLHAAGCAVREERSYHPGLSCFPLSSCLEGAHHTAELHCDGHEAVFKIQYPSFAHSG